MCGQWLKTKQGISFGNSTIEVCCTTVYHVEGGDSDIGPMNILSTLFKKPFADFWYTSENYLFNILI